MVHYEMLTVMPGTLAETEVAPLVLSVKETIEKFGGTEVVAHDMGKSRLAYPMKHIRYGYFYLTQFQAETLKINEIRSRVQLLNNLLRVVIREYDPARQRMDADKMNLTPLSNVVGVTASGEEYNSASQSREHREHKIKEFAAMQSMASLKKVEKSETVQEDKEEPVAAPISKKTSEQTLSMEDIDAKLDEILEKDLGKI